MSSRWTKYLSQSGNIRAVAIEAPDLVTEICERHKLTQDLTQGLSEALLGGLLLAASQKVGERVNLSIQSTGVWRQTIVDAYPEGFVRGFIVGAKPGDWENKQRGPWGNGMITILHTKNSEGQRPYSGTVALETGTLDKDLTYYWNQSAQIPSNLVLSVRLDGSKVSQANALLVQAIAGATPEEVQQIQSSAEALLSVCQTQISKPLPSLNLIFSGADFKLMEELPLRFRCNCTQDRVEEALLLTGAEDLTYLLADKDHIEAKCDFCSHNYILTRDKVEDMIRKMSRGNA